MRNLPHHAFAHNQTWLEVSLIAQDLLCWTKLVCLQSELTKAEPKRLRHCLLHTAGKVVRHGRRTQLKLDRDWPWSQALAAAFHAAARDPSALLNAAAPATHPTTTPSSIVGIGLPGNDPTPPSQPTAARDRLASADQQPATTACHTPKRPGDVTSAPITALRG